MNTQPFDVSDAVIELMHRYERGEFSDRVQQRLETIFTTNPDDAVERLEIAAKHLKITGGDTHKVAPTTA